MTYFLVKSESMLNMIQLIRIKETVYFVCITILINISINIVKTTEISKYKFILTFHY